MQSCFTDGAGLAWRIEITIPALRRVRALTGVDLMEILNGEDLLQRMERNPVLLADVLYALCKPEADERKVTDEQFGLALGPAIEDAVKALIDAVVSFCPNPRRRAALGVVHRKAQAAVERATDLLETKVNSEEFDRELDAALGLRTSSGGPSGTAPGSSGST